MVELFLGPRSDKMRRGAKSTLLCSSDRIKKNGTHSGPVFIGISYEAGISRLGVLKAPFYVPLTEQKNGTLTSPVFMKCNKRLDG